MLRFGRCRRVAARCRIRLAIVRDVVELHGGTVVAHGGVIGKGATVRVTIPLAAQREHPARRTGRIDSPCERTCNRMVQELTRQ
jgi:hypothetical protein